MVFNLEADLAHRLCREVDPCGPLFASLPVDEQLRRLRPILNEQKTRDRARLSPFCRRKVARG